MILVLLGVDRRLAPLTPSAARGQRGTSAVGRVLLVHVAVGSGGTTAPEPIEAVAVLPHLDGAVFRSCGVQLAIG